jgi:hypothetical protein
MVYWLVFIRPTRVTSIFPLYRRCFGPSKLFFDSRLTRSDFDDWNFDIYVYTYIYIYILLQFVVDLTAEEAD